MDKAKYFQKGLPELVEFGTNLRFFQFSNLTYSEDTRLN
jgi:hypothetical protein